MNQEDEKNNNVILIIGDWMVDEYWFLVRHHSDISAHTGFVHYRLACDELDTISGLCGAGHVARVLYELRAKNKDINIEDYKLVGLGKWHGDDQDIIGHLVHAGIQEGGEICLAASAAFRLKRQTCKHNPDIKLISLDENSKTIRVVRLYHQENGGIEQINRIDWEPERQPMDNEEYNLKEMPNESEVKFIVVQDFQKGVVTRELIENIKLRYPNARWFVRSKSQNPEWLNVISDNMEVFFIGPEIAATISPWDNWISNSRITDTSLKIIEKLPGKNVILISNKHEVIVRANDICITGKSENLPTPITELGWPSVFFASLVHSSWPGGRGINEEDIEKALKLADKFGNLIVPQKSAPSKPEKKEQNITLSISKSEWNIEIKNWKQAKENLGLIEYKKDEDDIELSLEVWRGSTQLPGYISCIEEKKEIIDRIGRHLRRFAISETPPRSLSIMLQADPGSGKTFLAKRLADVFGFSFLRYDVTQMINRDEMLDLFDTVATRQANIKSKVLVFVDEINALLDGSHAFGAFLAPLEEGIYIRRGKYFSLKPCVWVFAGTKLESKDMSAGEKLSDFESRMELIEKIDYKSLESHCKDTKETNILRNQARLEQVYLGATLIKNHYSDVREISEDVLRQFYGMDPANAPARKIRKMATSLSNVQYGRITRKNCSTWENANWSDTRMDENMVKLKFG
ncbi:MAG TPA: AAA family ATPase [Candidatus Deferrimicrobium sp.]|nr:AAA family ATPase [Candidatus Deferrimicrobium sp.]